MGIPYKIKYCVSVRNVDFDRKKDYLGCVDFGRSEIRILSGGRSRKAMEKIIWHEVLHAIISEQGLVNLLGKKEEAVVSNIASALMTVKFE